MIKIANAPCSWGVLEFDLEGETYSYSRVLDEIKDTGYEGTEFGDWGFMPTEPDRLRDELQKRGLELVGAFVPVFFADPQQHRKGRDLALKTARLLRAAAGEAPLIILADDNCKDPVRTRHAGRITQEMQLSPEQWHHFTEGVMSTARAVREETGLQCVFHHHCGGFIETPAEVEYLMEQTDPELLGLCLDTGHFLFGGGDPVQAFKTYRSRIRHIHFKDCDLRVREQAAREEWDYFQAVRQGIFCPLGEGGVDFPGIVDEIRRSGYRGWIVVEQDVLPGMGAPKLYARKNREYLRQFDL